MQEFEGVLAAFAVVFVVAALTTGLFQWMRQPVIVGYLIAGAVVGPHLPTGLVADHDAIATLSELGVVLLMFCLGLEFSLRKLIKVGPRAVVVALIECGLMLWLGLSLGRLLGWPPRECFFAGAVVAISSTTIIAKAFQERKVEPDVKELVVGVLVIEDLIAVLLMASLATFARGMEPAPRELAIAGGRLVTFLTSVIVVGLLLVPRLVRAVRSLGRSEPLLILCMGVCFALALIARDQGYSVALGAFLAGALVAESGEERHIIPLVRPVRDVFGAVFFVSVGMDFDPGVLESHAVVVVALTLVVLAGKSLSVSLGVFLIGRPLRTAVQTGMSMAQIGEFSFILAGLGVSLGATRPFLLPVVVGVSALTTFTTPWFMQLSGHVAGRIDARMPQHLQTFSVLYGSWLERLRLAPKATKTSTPVVNALGVLLLDAVLLVAIFVVTDLYGTEIEESLVARLGLSGKSAHIAFTGATLLACAPFGLGILRASRRLGVLLAEMALPSGSSPRADLALAPRRVLVVVLQLAFVLVVGIPIAVVAQPFTAGYPAAVVLLVMVAALSIGIWRSASDLEGHLRAGSRVVIDALAAQARSGSHEDQQDLAVVARLLPGLGEISTIVLSPACAAVGQSLADLQLRGATGASVISISRGDQHLLAPSSKLALEAGDLLVLTGSVDAVQAARKLLSDDAKAKNA